MQWGSESILINGDIVSHPFGGYQIHTKLAEVSSSNRSIVQSLPDSRTEAADVTTFAQCRALRDVPRIKGPRVTLQRKGRLSFAHIPVSQAHTMRRFLSTRRASTALEPMSEKGNASTGTDTGTVESSAQDVATERNTSTTALLPPSAPLPLPSLKVKRVDYYYSKWSKSWKYKNMGEKVTPETVPVGAVTGNDPWQSFCFVVVRSFPRQQEDEEPTFQVIIKSPYLLQACKSIIQKIPGISWNAEPLQVNTVDICADLCTDWTLS